MRDKMQTSVGVRFCSNCENNLRCEECVYPKKYEELLEKHDCVLGEAQRAKEELDRLRDREKAITEQFNELGQNYEALYTENVKLQDEIVTWKRISDDKTKTVIEYCNVIEELHKKIERLERFVKKVNIVRVLRKMAGEN